MVLLESQVKLKAGDIAPDFELLGIDDKKHSLNVCINLHAQINIITQKDLRSTKSSYKTCQVVVMRKSSYSYKQR